MEAGSYSRAAESLRTTKSSVSRRISRLEGRLGVRLFVRTTRSVRLTEEGAAFSQRVGGAVEEVREAARTMRDLGGAPRGLLRLTAPSDLPFIGELLAGFRDAYPEITVDVLMTQRTVDLVGEGYDVALRAGPLADSSMIARAIGIGRVVVVASPAEHELETGPVHVVLPGGRHLSPKVRVFADYARTWVKAQLEAPDPE